MSDLDSFWRAESLKLTARILELEQELETQARIAQQTWARWAAAMSKVKMERDELRQKLERIELKEREKE